MVWPIKSGTIVDRRDQVLTTFFSLRVFSPSTFSRRCPSTNGPFFSERAISLLFLDAAQTAPGGMPHLLETTYRAGNAMRLRAKRANKPRTQRIRRAVHNHRPSGLAQLVEHRLQRNRHRLAQNHGYFCRGFRRQLRSHSLCYTLAGPLRAAAYRCPASCCTAASCRSHRFCSSLAVCFHRECSPSGLLLQTNLSQGCKYQPSDPTSGARRCACRYACCAGSSCPTLEMPTAFAGDCLLPCLHHHRAGDPQGSWPRREPSDEFPSSGCVQPCHRFRFRGRDCRPGQPSPCSPRKTCELRPKAA